MPRNEESIIAFLVLPLRPTNSTSPSGAAIYEEPSPDDGSHQIVAVKKYSKFHNGLTRMEHYNSSSSSFSSCRQSGSSSVSAGGGSASMFEEAIATGHTCASSSTSDEEEWSFRKEAWILQQLGKHGKDVLECMEVLEDSNYIYVICELPRFGSLEYVLPEGPISSSVRTTSSSRKCSNHKREEQIKTVFRQLFPTVGRLHRPGVCHESLSPSTILWREDDKDDENNDSRNHLYADATTIQTPSMTSSSSAAQGHRDSDEDYFASRLFVNDFSLSLLLPTSLDGLTIRRHWIQPIDTQTAMFVVGDTCILKKYITPKCILDNPSMDQPPIFGAWESSSLIY
jgi:hypothetical protein